MQLALELVVRSESFSAASLVRDALHDAGASITRANRLSNKALVYHFEIAIKDTTKLQAALMRAGQLLEPGATHLTALGADSARELAGVLHVLLVHEQPDQRVELPKVPG